MTRTISPSACATTEKKKKLGVFSLKGKSAEVEVPVKDGNYVNYITGETVTVQGGKLRCAGEPVIISE